MEPVCLMRMLVDAIHSDQIRQHGGSYGIRDAGLIESALARPINRWQYEPTADLHALAAAYGYGLAKNHGYVDGNKRIAFVAMYTFLAVNGLEIDTPEPDVVSMMLELAAGDRDETQVAEWLRTRTIPISDEE